MKDLNLSQLISENKNKVLNFFIIIIALMVGFNIYKYQIKDIASFSNKREMGIKRNKLLGDIGVLSEQYTKLKKSINAKVESDTSIESLGAIAKESSVEITSFKPLPQLEYSTYFQRIFDLTIIAKNYHKMALFISKIENAPNFYVVNKLDIVPIYAPNGDLDKVTVNLTLSTILLKD